MHTFYSVIHKEVSKHLSSIKRSLCLLHKYCYAGFKFSYCHKILSRRLQKQCKPHHCLGAPEHFHYCWKCKYRRDFSLALYHSYHTML